MAIVGVFKTVFDPKVGKLGRRRVTGPQFALGSIIQQTEGSDGLSKTYSFPLVLAGDGGDNDSSVDWAVIPAEVNSADANDFVGGVLPSGTIVFGPSDSLKYIDVSIVSDTVWEPDEGFYIELSNPINASILVPRATGGILNDDAPPLPGDITNLSLASKTTTTITVAFTASYAASAHQYRLNGGTPTTLPTNNTITGLINNTAYTVEVRGTNATGNGNWSNLINVTTNAVVIGTITDLTVPSVSTTTATLNFTALPNALSYEYRLNGGIAVALPGDQIITGLTDNTTYSVEVRGINGPTTGAWSSVVQFTTNLQIINVGSITDLTVPSVSDTTATLAFTNATNAASHEYRLNGGTATALASDKIITGLIATTSYSVEVRGVNGQFTGAWSNVANFTTIAIAANTRLTSDGSVRVTSDGSIRSTS